MRGAILALAVWRCSTTFDAPLLGRVVSQCCLRRLVILCYFDSYQRLMDKRLG
jgi:hypothetical protein